MSRMYIHYHVSQLESLFLPAFVVIYFRFRFSFANQFRISTSFAARTQLCGEENFNAL